MNARVQPPAVLLPFPASGAWRAAQGNVLAVVGGPLDTAVVDLAMALAHQDRRKVDLLLLVEVPPALPLRAYGEWLVAQGAGAPLEEAEQHCSAVLGEAEIVVCRSSGPALVAEAQARGSTDLVLAVGEGGWWRRRRTRRAVAHVQARAHCRVYVIHTPPPADLQPQQAIAQ
jgi:hypothetical protein